uniref:Uncharacterized protein n=1 Tax=Micrurus lemniscatus lemniscatus TaxID=129467 RepID=A0A2D4ISD6_MICLE
MVLHELLPEYLRNHIGSSFCSTLMFGFRCVPTFLSPLFSKLFQEADLLRLKQTREQELRFIKEQADLDVAQAEALAAVEVKKFEAVIDSLGASTIRDIAMAGPEMQVKLLQGLGIQSTLITDGSSPINLFTAAGGLLGILPKPSEK